MTIAYFSRVRRTAVGASLLVATASAATRDLGGGFREHGVATPVSNHRGTVATVDAEGRNIVLVWLFDHRGGYALLLIEVATGKAEQYPVPFPSGGDCPFASILSSRNRFYTHFNSHFVEFDPARRAFTFHHKTVPQMAMGMTEDDNGVIWSVTYPQSGVASFNPITREFRDYGHVHKENWAQYQRHVAADDAGWIYFGIGSTASHIIGFDPATATAKPMIPEDQRVHGDGVVYRDVSGKVYGWPGGSQENWYEFHRGQARRIGRRPTIRAKSIITGSQSLFYREFPDGTRLEECDLVERILTVRDRTGRLTKRKFDYTSEGAHVMGLAAAPDGTICGGTAFPMRFFRYDPRTDRWTNRASYGQWNTVARQGDRFFVGGYTGGFLLEWDPARPWVETRQGDPTSNPRFLTECQPVINRPHDLLAHPDGNTLILAGTPGYGLTGGGLLLWERASGKRVLLEHTDILPQHSTMSLVALPQGKLLGGTTTAPGTGGERKAPQAELYLLDLATHRLEWHAPVLAGAQEYSDLCLGPDGLVYGFADSKRFFAFDPRTRRVVHKRDTSADLGPTNSQQGPRTFIRGPKDAIYVLFVKGVAVLEPGAPGLRLLAPSPVPVGPGGDYLDGRVYFASRSRVYSYAVEP